MIKGREDRNRFGELLVEMRLVDEAALSAAMTEQRSRGGRLVRILAHRGAVDEDRLVKAVGSKLGLETVNLGTVRIHPRVLARLPAEVAERHGMLPYAVKKTAQSEVLYLVVSDPLDTSALTEAQRQSGCQIRVMLAPATALEQSIRDHYGRADGSGGSVPVTRPREAPPRRSSSSVRPRPARAPSSAPAQPSISASGLSPANHETRPRATAEELGESSRPRPSRRRADDSDQEKTVLDATIPALPSSRVSMPGATEDFSQDVTLPGLSQDDLPPFLPPDSTPIVEDPFHEEEKLGESVDLWQRQVEASSGPDPAALRAEVNGSAAAYDDVSPDPMVGSDSNFDVDEVEAVREDPTDSMSSAGRLLGEDLLELEPPPPPASDEPLPLEVPVPYDEQMPNPFVGPALSEIPVGLGETGIIPDPAGPREGFQPPPPEVLPADRKARLAYLADDIPVSEAEVEARSQPHLVADNGSAVPPSNPIFSSALPPPSSSEDDIADIEEVHLDPIEDIEEEFSIASLETDVRAALTGVAATAPREPDVRAALTGAAAPRAPSPPPQVVVTTAAREEARRLLAALEDGKALSAIDRDRVLMALGRALLKGGVLPRDALLEELER